MTDRQDYRFSSDNTAGICPEALAAPIEANSGRSAGYGHDAQTRRAVAQLRELFETDCEVAFVFSGTAANALSLSALCRGYQSIFCHEFAHVETGECAAPEFFSGGSKVIPVPGPGGKMHLAEFERALGRGRGFHFPKPGALSLAQSSDWGTLYHPDEIRALAAVAHGHGVGVHLDGARFANALAVWRERGPYSAAELTWRAGVDVLSLGGTKNGMLTAEAVVFFRKEFATDFELRVMQAGQLNSKMRFAAAQWSALLKDGAWLRHAAHANAMAAQLAAGLGSIPGLRLLTEAETNMVFIELSPAAAAAMHARGWRFFKFIGDHGYRLVCAWDTRPEDLQEFLSDLRRVITV